MEYDLTRLGSEEFEHLAQSLLRAEFGARVSLFGDGPDGGREATWEDGLPGVGKASDWTGYGVAQAKARRDQASVSQNLTWLQREITKELQKWADPKKRRDPKPKDFLLITNVRLSSVPGAGIDKARHHLASTIAKLRLPIEGAEIWHYDDVRALLDAHSGVRTSYLAWITPGDVLAQVLEDTETRSDELRRALTAHVARSLDEDNRLNLTQAGSARETPLTVADVFTRLPIAPDSFHGNGASATEDFPADAIQLLIDRSDQDFGADSGEQALNRRTVLIGGPGQGKSTVTQYLAQVYRAEFLRGSPVAADPQVANALHKVDQSVTRLDLKRPVARRWPVRIVMTRLADALESKTSDSVLDFIAQQVSARGSVPVTAEDMRRWLRAYPWVMIIDGLDEVPKSSNRDDVLRSLNDFFIDSTSLNADVTVIATTRPQGYNNELDRRQYAHFELIPLDADIAMQFAENFIALRTGRGTERSEELLDKFRSASTDESTSRLLTSPLQVTIFVILLERLGKAPRDRWRLFSAYYRVIFQREQEKPGELAALLSDYQRDIELIHRRVGFVLQERSSEAGGTSSHLTLSEFKQIVEDHLLKQGHRRREAKALRKRLISLATERLVFLAFLGSRQVGFEIRSLQEFMAGEYITLLKRRRIASTLESIALRSHWDNVVLFALGKILAEHEQLRPEVLLLCETLDNTAQLPSVVKPGAELALNVLLDGACATQPRYEELLTAQALRLLDGPVSSRISDLAQLARGSKGARRLVLRACRFDANQHSSGRINALLLLGEISELGYERGRRQMADAVQQETPSVLAQTVFFAMERRGRELLDEVATRASEIRFDEMSTVLGRVMWAPVSVRRPKDATNPFVSLKSALMSGSIWQRQRSHPSSHQLAGGVTLNRSGVEVEQRWRELLDVLPTESGIWPEVVGVARFAAAPSTDSLAEVLESLSGNFRSWSRWAPSLPWPINACVDYVRTLVLDCGASFEEGDRVCRELAEFARAGRLGNENGWREFQERVASSNENSLVAEVGSGPLVPLGGKERDLPVWDVSDSGSFPAFGFVASTAHPRGVDDFLSLVDTAIRFLRRGDEIAGPVGQAWLNDTAAFLLSVAGDSIDLDGESGTYHLVHRHYVQDEATGKLEQRVELGDRVDVTSARSGVLELRPYLAAQARGAARLGLLAFFSPVELVSHDLLATFAISVDGLSRRFGASRGRLAEFVMDSDALDLDEAARLRLALCLDTRCTIARIREGIDLPPEMAEALPLGRAVDLIVRANVSRIYAGEYDAPLRRLLSGAEGRTPEGADRFSARAVLDLSSYMESAHATAVTLRGAHLMLAADAIAASQLSGGLMSDL